MKLSIVIPVFNEEKTIVTILDRVVAAELQYDFEILVDG